MERDPYDFEDMADITDPLSTFLDVEEDDMSDEFEDESDVWDL